MNKEALRTSLVFLDSWLGYRSRQLDFPGFVVTICSKDSLVFSRAYGLADTERTKPLTTGHRFSMASQSKMFTTTAVLQLVAQHKLRLDDMVCDYLPWLTKHRDTRFQEISIRQLLSHSAGLIRDGREADFLRLSEPFPTDTALRKIILASDLLFEPNTRPKYSNLGVALVGQVIAAASGQTYAKYVHEHIIETLMLHNTTTDYAPPIDTHLVTGYGVPYDRYRPALRQRRKTLALMPAMGIHATTEDMCRFASAHFFGNETILPDQLKREMQRSAWSLRQGYDSGTEAGLGLEVLHIGERRVVGHTGHLAGHASATFFDPYEQLVVAVAGNCKDMPVAQMIRGIFEALDWFALEQGKPTPKGLARFPVRLCGPTAIVEVVASGQHLVVIDPDDWEPFTWCEELEQVDANTLRITTPGSIQSEGELICYTFHNSAVQSVRYGGITLTPETTYKHTLTRQQPN